MNTRRAFLQTALLAPALAPALLRGVPVAAASAAFDARDPAWDPRALFAPLQAGQEVGFGWSVAEIFPPHQGAITLTLQRAAQRVRVDVALRDGAPKGPAATPLLDFIVMDGASGDGAPMDEPLGRALRRLAALVEANEEAQLAHLDTLEAHGQRVQRHAAAMAVASRQLTPGDPA